MASNRSIDDYEEALLGASRVVADEAPLHSDELARVSIPEN